MDSDERYMWVALDLARQGRGKTSPNPMVGRREPGMPRLSLCRKRGKRPGEPHCIQIWNLVVIKGEHHRA